MQNKIVAVAITEYADDKIRNLNNCLTDTNSIIGVLLDRYTFEEIDIELLSAKEQTTKSHIYNRLYDIFTNAMEDDNLLLLYAGHGEYNPTIGTAYWQTYDSIKSDASTWLNVSDLLDFIKASKAKHISIISDSCFSGAIFDTLERGGGIEAIENRMSRYALTSGGLERVSDGLEGKSSPFAETLISVLKNNSTHELFFTKLAEDVILQFNPARTQTPRYGSLSNVGHDGGTFILRLKQNDHSIKLCQDFNLSMNLSSDIPVDYDITIPIIKKNSDLDYGFINSFIQQKGYKIISDIRNFFYSDKEYYIELSKKQKLFLEVGYNVKMVEQRFLSIILSRFDYLGGAHPNNYIYTINFVLNPDRQICLPDFVNLSDYETFELFLRAHIEAHAEADSKEVLKEYASRLNQDTVEFSIDEEKVTIYFLNVMPRAIISQGFLNIPLNKLKLIL